MTNNVEAHSLFSRFICGYSYLKEESIQCHWLRGGMKCTHTFISSVAQSPRGARFALLAFNTDKVQMRQNFFFTDNGDPQALGQTGESGAAPGVGAVV